MYIPADNGAPIDGTGVCLERPTGKVSSGLMGNDATTAPTCRKMVDLSLHFQLKALGFYVSFAALSDTSCPPGGPPPKSKISATRPKQIDVEGTNAFSTTRAHSCY